MCRRYRSDAWDSGNSLTWFYEEIETCPECGGKGIVEDEEEKPCPEPCPECRGEGVVVRYYSA